MTIYQPFVPPRKGIARRLAHWRKPATRILALAFVGVLVLTTAPGTPLSVLIIEMAGFLLIITGALGRIWCALYIAGRKNSELCRDGPYSICRNPLYVFSFFGALGLAFVARLELLGLILIPVFWSYHHFVIKAEETNLRSLFGRAYYEYSSQVPRIVPNMRLYWSRSSLVINPRIMMRVLSEVAWFLIALTIFEAVEHLRGASLGEASLPVLFTWPF